MNQQKQQPSETAPTDRLYTRHEAKAALRIGDTKYWGLIKQGKLEVVRLGRRTTRVTGRSIAALMAGDTSHAVA
jgi:hypothetical protein